MNTERHHWFKEADEHKTGHAFTEADQHRKRQMDFSGPKSEAVKSTICPSIGCKEGLTNRSTDGRRSYRCADNRIKHISAVHVASDRIGKKFYVNVSLGLYSAIPERPQHMT